MENEQNTLTPLAALGEFGLIDRLTSGIGTINMQTVKGIGDDAAVIDAGGQMILVSTDMLVEGIHFDLTYSPLRHLGYKAAVVNISDICAMNGKPLQLFVSMAISARFSVEAIEEVYAGIRLACERYGLDLAGGDTTTSRAGLILSVTVTGVADENEIVYRNTAAEHDLVCVTGNLGAAYMGLLLLEREKAVFKANPEMQPDLDKHGYVLERQLKPEARTDITSVLKEAGVVPTSMIDISDGLGSEIIHICRASSKGCLIYEDKIPFDPATLDVCDEFNIDPATAALNGGEDYELLFTISQKDYEKVSNIRDISVIGHITDQQSGIHLVTRSGQQFPIQAQGWDALMKMDQAGDQSK